MDLGGPNKFGPLERGDQKNLGGGAKKCHPFLANKKLYITKNNTGRPGKIEPCGGGRVGQKKCGPLLWGVRKKFQHTAAEIHQPPLLLKK